MYRDREESFGSYLSRRREDWGFTYEQLGEGLCSAAHVLRIEKEEREPDKAFKDRLLARVGISPDMYENFLFGDDYEPWKLRQQICGAVMKREEKRARELLKRYEEVCRGAGMGKAGERLERQFVLSMEGQLRRLAGAPDEELAGIFEEALKLTVPGADKGIRGKALSVHELNLLTEYLRYRRPEDRTARYEELLDYIERSHLDVLSRARVYPKAVCYFCGSAMEEGLSGEEETPNSIWKPDAVIRLCNRSIGLLRKTGRMYCLWELLTIRGAALTKLARGLQGQGEERRAESLIPMREENEEWLRVIEHLYEEYGVSCRTEDFCYLYVEKEVYCIGDVIRIRRNMLGMSRRELCENICSEKTLGRLERNQLRTQRAIVLDLFDRLGLAAEYRRTELITDSLEAKERMDELRKSILNWECERTEELIKRIEELIPMEHPSNRQVMMRYRAVNEHQRGKLTDEKFCEEEIKALECTLPFEAAMSPGEKYMTNEEVLCIQNIASNSTEPREVRWKYIEILCGLYRFCEENGVIASFINMYEVVMEHVMSELGNMGEYARSDEISRTVITECLRMRRIYGIYKSIYNIMWNDAEQQKEGILIERKRNSLADLQNCITLCEFCRKKWQANFYSERLLIYGKK